MARHDLFSSRKKRAHQQGQTDVYQYTELPRAFRVQVVHIWERALPTHMSALDRDRPVSAETAWDEIEADIAEGHGLYRLPWRDSRIDDGPFHRVFAYLISLKNADSVLDLIELVFRRIDNDVRRMGRMPGLAEDPDVAIDDLNHRFREHNIGYQFDGGQLIRVDSQYLHAEVVKPALVLLATRGFEGPEQEFLAAHRHYREGKYKESINDALKAFESVMKTICDAREWPYDKATATAKVLVNTILTNGLLPQYLQTTFSGVRQVLEGAVPTVRNKMSGHGQGPDPLEVPEHFARYALNMAATNIVLLIEAHTEVKGEVR